MSIPKSQQSRELRGALSGAGPTIDEARETIEWLAAAPVTTVMTVMGGSSAFLVAHALSVADNLVLIASSVLGMSIGAFLSRYIGPAAVRRRRDEIDLRRQAAATVIATWKSLPAKAPQDVVKQLGNEVGIAMSLPNLNLEGSRLMRFGKPGVALPAPDRGNTSIE